MYALYSIVLLLFLLGLGVPVAWSFAGMLAMLTYLYDVNLNTLMLQGFRSLNSVVLLALPLFIMAGYLMQSGGVAQRLIEFIETLVRGRRGGLGASLVLASGLFGAIAGTASAAVASIGTIMVDPMAQRGYPRAYSSALLGQSSLLGILIPPSITMILLAVVTQQSVVAFFAATIGPAILLMLGLILVNYLFSGGWLFTETPPDASEPAAKTSRLRSGARAFPALCMPILILGGIYGGIFTPTEAAAIAVLLVVFIGFFIYRDLTLARLREGLVRSAETTGIIVLILLFSFLIGRILVAEGVPQDLTEFVTGLVDSPIAILLIVNLFLIVVGMLIDDVSLTVVIAPLLLPLVGVADIHPVQFAAIVACAVVVSANSPPMAPILYLSCRVGKVVVHQSFRPAILLIVLVAIPIQLLTTFIPAISLFFPRLLGLI
ncbi:TRAP transporter large permease [Achromobacter sp. F4_2707]|uniref:TRAP transporter large permease n=1 Tax=Achromobacter sp. F4_2707 TaxID=3114286 RepID=UPI0039C6809D